MWNACSQADTHISLVSNKEDEEDNTSDAYFAHHKKGVYKKFKGPKKKVDPSKLDIQQFWPN